jgi:nucleoside-diphosphate-sugar epimerase
MNETIKSPGEIDSSKKILVTGAAGLLGGEVVRQLLDQGFSVTAVIHTAPLRISHPKLIIRNCNILDTSCLEEIMPGISHVYHCAAFISFESKDKSSLFKVNVEGTENIVNACLDANIKKLVHVSSVSALGRIRNDVEVNEQMNWSEETGNSAYGKSKFLGELEVWRGRGEGLDTVIVNPSIILGGNNWDNGSSAIFKSIYNEFKWYTEGASGFVDVRDVAKAMIHLMNSNITGERFIISGENLSYKEIFYLIAKYFGKNPPPRKVSPALAEIVWRAEALKSFFTGQKRLLTKETARTSQATVRYDNSKILNSLPGFNFTPIAETIAYTCKTLKENYHL